MGLQERSSFVCFGLEVVCMPWLHTGCFLFLFLSNLGHYIEQHQVAGGRGGKEKKNQFVIWFEGFDFLWWASISLKATLFAHKRAPWRVKQGIVSGSIKQPRSFVWFIQGINCGALAGTRLSAPPSVCGGTCSTRAHIQKSLRALRYRGIDTSVINSPYYLLSGGSRPRRWQNKLQITGRGLSAFS